MTHYTIPLKYRKMENLHIVFWLFKDIGWCMLWRPLGLTMIVPTLSIAIIIAYRARHMASELYHNLAITFWIAANSCWMIIEFMHMDTVPLYGIMTYKHLALIPFLMGVFCLAYYYGVYQPRHPNEIETM